MPLDHALDEHRREIHVADAQTLKRYTCKYCGVDVFRKSKGGTFFFCCYPNQEHTHKICINLVNSTKTHTIRGLENPDDFIRKLLTQQEDTSRTGISTSPTDSNSVNRHTLSKSEGGYQEIPPIKNLKHIWDADLTKTLTANENIGPIKACEFIIFMDWFEESFKSGRFERGLRIIQARPDYPLDDNKKKIKFSCFHKQGGDWHRAYFFLAFEDQSEFKAYADRLFSMETAENGTKKFVRKFAWVLLAGNWSKYPVSNKKPPAYETKFTNKSQIYCCPNSK